MKGPSAQKLQNSLAVCESNQRADHHHAPPPGKMKFCPQTQQLVSDADFGLCNFCFSVLSPTLADSSCPVCSLGDIIHRTKHATDEQ
jgi:hypothetical protein